MKLRARVKLLIIIVVLIIICIPLALIITILSNTLFIWFEKTFAETQNVDLVDKSLRNFVPFKSLNESRSAVEGDAQ